MARSRTTFGVLALAVLPAPGGAQDRQDATLDDVVEWLEPLLLEETESALNARPRLTLDPDGGFIVTDDQEAQIRIYDPEGRLVVYFGREGGGPGEFRRLSIAVRLRDRRICALDFDGRLSLWSPEGELEDDVRTDLRGVLSAAPAGEDRLAVVTTPNVPSFDSLAVPMVPVLDLESRSVLEEFLVLPLAEDNVMAALTVVGSVAPISSRRFGVTWTVFDSLWIADLSDSRGIHVIQLESRALSENRPPVDRRRDPEGFGPWLNATTFPGEAHPAPGGGWLINLSRIRAREDGSLLLHVDPEGRRIWEVATSQRLLAVDSSSGVLYFSEPTGLVPNEFRRARLRR